MSALTRFRVVGLHGRRTYDIQIVDNRLILVGENGTGKSTAANFIYYFLSQQWNRLREYKFESIEAVVGGTEFRITSEQIELFREQRRQVERHVPQVMQRALFRFTTEQQVEEILENRGALAQMSYELGLSERRVRDVLLAYLHEAPTRSVELQEIGSALSAVFTDQLLYLPTYRRIEQDLKSIFRGVETEVRSFRERVAHSRATSAYIELVEFGMEDVEQTINNRMTAIKESVRTGLNNLTGTYLRDVIRGVHSTVSVERFRQIDAHTLDSMFARIDEATLPKHDKVQLKLRVADMLGKGDVDKEDRVIVLFLSKLFELYRAQEENERDVREFVRVCNDYLVGKQLVYDDVNYGIQIRHTDADQMALLEKAEHLQLKMLSSGEKQIVSLFSHIFLSGKRSFFVIIDEPELSLSVPWQRRFLPDILASGFCAGLVAVTHSPFIWQNELEPYVHSLTEFVGRGDVVYQ